MLNAQGMVAEASVANIFVVRGGVLLTPTATDGALEGITRDTVLDLAAALGIPAREQTLGRFDLFAAAEAFLTGSGAGIVPIRSLDGRPVGSVTPGPLYEKIRAAFADAAVDLGTPVWNPGPAQARPSRVG
jgi:branched-chain amino acid aminotransferase